MLGIKCAKSETVVGSGSEAPHDPAGGGSLPGLGPAEPRTRLLLVDDELLVVQMLRDLLVDAPFAIETATDGYEALVKVGTFRPGCREINRLTSAAGIDSRASAGGAPARRRPAARTAVSHSLTRREG